MNNMKRDWLLNIMVLLLMALGGYTLKEVHANSKSLVMISQIVYDGKEARLKAEGFNNSAHEKIEAAVQELISKREFDVRVADINTQIQDIRSRIIALEMKLSQFKP
jgi:hypothetical protein